MNKIIIIFLVSFLKIYSQSASKYISIEWEPIPDAKEFILQISNESEFKKVLYQTKTKDSKIRLEPNPLYRFGRIAAFDKHGIRGEYSEIFEIEQRIIVEEQPKQLPSNYVGKNHSIKLQVTPESIAKLNTYYKVNDGIWLTYHEGVQLTKEGENEIFYYSDNKLGRKEEIKRIEYILDSEAPEVEVRINQTTVELGRNYYTSKKSTFEVFARDKITGVKKVRVYFNTREKSILGEIKDGQVQIPKELNGQVVEVAVYAEDNIGNSKINYLFIKHDAEPPIVNLHTNYEFNDKKEYFYYIHVNAYDLHSGLDKIYYSVDGSGFEVYGLPIKITSPGEHEIRIYATDIAGNKSDLIYDRVLIKDLYSKSKTTSSLLLPK